MAGVEFASPTVGLWLGPDDFLRLASDLPRYLAAELRPAAEASARLGYPVGRLEDVQIQFQHYRSFEGARSAWERRSRRVRLDDVVLVFTDRDGCDAGHLDRFDALPFRKIAFTARAGGPPSTVLVEAYRGQPCVGDLASNWGKLEPALTAERIRRLFGPPAFVAGQP